MEIVLIAAMAANRVIGRDNDIPWHVPGEQGHFRAVTWGHALVMGRKTWQSIGRPLPGRHNVVISRNPDLVLAGCEVCHSLPGAIAACGAYGKVFIIGGAQLYEQAMIMADMIILTRLAREVAGDVYFPQIDQADFILTGQRQIAEPEPYVIEHWFRRQVA